MKLHARTPRILLLLVVAMLCCIACNKNTKPNVYGYYKTGVSARDLLTAEKYTKLVVEIQNMPGYQLDTVTLNNIDTFLTSLCTKPGGIEIIQSQINPTENTDSMSIESVIAMERRYRRIYTWGSTLAIHILVTNGHDAKGMIAGLAYYNTSIVVYGKTIAESYSGNEQQSFVLEHELGHIMGLVNCGTPMQHPHEDSIRVNHCNNPSCTMYFASGRTQLDSNCLADIAAIKMRKRK